MNIEKLVRHLKEFTLDEIEMIAECDCKTALEHLLNEGKIAFEQGLYKYVEKIEKTFSLFEKPELKNEKILFKDMAEYYITNRSLSKNTLKGYKSLLKYNLLPNFGEKYLDEITYAMIVDFMQRMKERYRPKTASNAVTLLGSILKSAFQEGYLKTNPYYGVKNSKCK
ncbi:phage integrase SAM-like domain-containing protein [bacterium]|nr:phage integrase SAM-like domain-containing protein [bacterium]